jgi:hypothetical protein
VVVYFLIIALACLRFDLPLVWFATGGAIAGYVFLTGYAYWYADRMRVDRHAQLIFLVALVLTGVIVGQVIRRVRHMAEDYARRQGQSTPNT